MSRLLACPFCRELFDQAEAQNCPECDIPLEPLQRLPPSLADTEREALDWERDRPEDELRPWHDFRHGRGILLGIALASLGAFWLAPWVDISSPHAELRTAYSLARGRVGWLWGGAIAWFMTLALVASRRSLHQMRGVRAILVSFSAMTWAEILILVLLSPRASREVHVAYGWAWGLYVSLGLSLAGSIASLRFGATPRQPTETAAPTSPGTEPPTVH